MAHQLGSEYDLPHGAANAILLPYVMEFNMEACPEKFANIAKAMGVDISAAKSIEEAAKMAVDAVRKLSKQVGIPSLKETAFNPADVEKLAEQAMRDVCMGGNPREVTKEDIMNLYMKAYEG